MTSLTISRIEVSRPPGVSSRMITSSAPSSAASSSAPEIHASVAGSIEPGQLDRDGDPGVVLRERTAGQQQSADADRDQRQGSTQRNCPHAGIIRLRSDRDARAAEEQEPDGADDADEDRRRHHEVLDRVGVRARCGARPRGSGSRRSGRACPRRGSTHGLEPGEDEGEQRVGDDDPEERDAEAARTMAPSRPGAASRPRPRGTARRRRTDDRDDGERPAHDAPDATAGAANGFHRAHCDMPEARCYRTVALLRARTGRCRRRASPRPM